MFIFVFKSWRGRCVMRGNRRLYVKRESGRTIQVDLKNQTLLGRRDVMRGNRRDVMRGSRRDVMRGSRRECIKR